MDSLGWIRLGRGRIFRSVKRIAEPVREDLRFGLKRWTQPRFPHPAKATALTHGANTRNLISSRHVGTLYGRSGDEQENRTPDQ
jgi:hypothetical protein